MTTRVTIRAAAAAGFPGRYRAGRFWPVSGRPVDLIDTDADAPDVIDKGVSIPQLGSDSLQALRADGAFSFDNGAAVADITAKLSDLETENAALKAKVSELEAALSNRGKGAGK